ncbi:MAG: DUF3604 domain-containing protein [Pseudomonadota bacterium]
MDHHQDEGGQGAQNQSGTLPHALSDSDLGHAALTPQGRVEAGSWQTLTLTYTCGKYGMDDSASMRLCFRFASDQSRLQLDDPTAPGFTTVTASNNAVLEVSFDSKGNVRPWDKTLYIKVVNGFMAPGDTVTIALGERSGGSPGLRMQTFCETSYELRVLVDPIATANYQTLPLQPLLQIVPGPPVIYAAVLPTERVVGQPFALKLKGEDRWGNPSDRCDATFAVRSNIPVAGLPQTVTLSPGEFATVIEGLSVGAPGDVAIWFEDAQGTEVFRANPLRIHAEAALLPYWVDLHGQSEETIGTGSAREYFTFARDRAFVDATAHQGNDFQITKAFWAQLGSLCEAFDEPGRFVALHGYEWSGNTALGGDRNVFFPGPGRQIRRSSHALVEDRSDADTDCDTAADLFAALAAAEEWDTVMYAHCGGRYADITQAHDGRFEKSVEVHSSWGSFEWLVGDALQRGYRVGIVANSDGHKGRPGASYPGRSMFGAIGGLTCMLMPELSREALLDAMRKRRHYGTSGGHGGRMVIDLRAEFDAEGTVYHDDPGLDYPTPPIGQPALTAMMGDIVHLPEGGAEIAADILAAAPIERVDLFNGTDLIETIRPYGSEDLGARIRILWEGAEYRGRFRQVIWDGGARVEGNAVERVQAINFFNPEKSVERVDAERVAWTSLTTGNFAGVDLWLADAEAGEIAIQTPLITCTLPVAEIALEDQIFDASGRLPRFLKVFRLPDANPHHRLSLRRSIPLRESGDNPIYLRLTQEDGTRAWTSPIYLCRTV